MPDDPVTFEHFHIARREDGSLHELGRGSMGVTYKAYDTRLDGYVALKVINAGYLNDDTGRERFLRESRAAAHLDHPNVAAIFHRGEDQGTYFYAMQFIEGETLNAYVHRRGPLPVPLALRLILQAAQGLAAANARGLIHRDIKPANLMIVHLDAAGLATAATDDDQHEDLLIKVIDFGLAKVVRGGNAASEVSLTGDGPIGTPYYMSPEQIDSAIGEVDARTDIYSLGVTLWYLLTGKPPFVGSQFQVFRQHISAPPPMVELPANVSATVRDLLTKMMAKGPGDRPANMRELITILRELLRSVQNAPAASPVPVAPLPAASPGTSAPSARVGSAPLDVTLAEESPVASPRPGTNAPVASREAFVPAPVRTRPPPGIGPVPPQSPAAGEKPWLAPKTPARRGFWGFWDWTRHWDWQCLRNYWADKKIRRFALGLLIAIAFFRLLSDSDGDKRHHKTVAKKAPADSGVALKADDSPAVAGKTFHVPGDYKTIQAALGAAKSGDTVEVAEGTYQESLALGDGVHLVGNGADDTVVESAGKSECLTVDHCASGSVAEIGFRHTGDTAGGAAAIGLHGSAVQLKEVTVKNAAGPGILCDSGDKSSITDCTVSAGHAAGIRIEGPDTAPTLDSNRVLHNADSGIVFDHGAAGVANATTCESNARYGIAVLGEGTKPVFQQTTAHDNASGNYDVFSGAAPIGLPTPSAHVP